MNIHLYNHLGFRQSRSSLIERILIPRYYNPEIPKRLNELSTTHDLPSLEDLVKNKFVKFTSGDEIGKLAYGTGNIPFIRTSDIANWELKADPKQGVSQQIYEKYSKKQDVRPGDILFVKDGTYLIGSICIITKADTKILYQSHLLKFRVSENSPISPHLLLAALSSPIVRKQVRAKQFTADIIDTIGNRFQELIIPIPKNHETCQFIEREVSNVINDRVRLRNNISKIPLFAQGLIPTLYAELPFEQFEVQSNLGFVTQFRGLHSRIFIPRYYDPIVSKELSSLSETHDIVSIDELIKQGVLSFTTGVEVGKMAYGTGLIPFIRTSDISNWELKSDPKQNVSEDIYELYKNKLDVRADDIFIVRDGTYLVGTSCIIGERDTELLYCGGIYKLRVKKPKIIDPYLLLVLLNTPIVRRQMKAKQFTRDVIDTLGKRLFEIMLPIPKDASKREYIAKIARETVEQRTYLRDKAKKISLDIEGVSFIDEVVM